MVKLMLSNAKMSICGKYMYRGRILGTLEPLELLLNKHKMWRCLWNKNSDQDIHRRHPSAMFRKFFRDCAM